MRLKNEDTCCRRRSSKLALGCNPGAQVQAGQKIQTILFIKIFCKVELMKTDEQLESILTRENFGGGL